MTEAVIVGFDLGTSGMKAVAINHAGEILARASAKYVTYRPESGASEQNPLDWIAATKEVTAAIVQATNSAPWSAIGLSGMLPTLVTVDENGKPIGSAITWEDGRAEAEGDELRRNIGEDVLYRRTGQWVDGRYLLPMLARLCTIEPDRVSHSTTLLGAKDFLYAWLTGKNVTDPSIATGFGCYDLNSGKWDEDVIEEYSQKNTMLDLPEIVPSKTLHPLSASAADALGLTIGVPVCVGAADSVLGAIGMGANKPGDIAYVAGTSTIILGISDTPTYDAKHRYLITPMVDAGTWGLEMDLLATGSAIRWLSQMFNLDDEKDLLALAARSLDDRAPTFVPYVAPGEQGALWDPTLTGSILGIDLGHSQADIARGLIDGIVNESARCVQTLDAIGFDKYNDDRLRVSGGSASDLWFRQQLADATSRRVQTTLGNEPDRSALGAAIVAGQAIGIEFSNKANEFEIVTPNESTQKYWTARRLMNDDARKKIAVIHP